MDSLLSPIDADIRTASRFAILANLIWLPQTAIIALVLARLLQGDRPYIGYMVICFVGLAIIRTVFAAMSEARSSAAGDSLIAQCRRIIVEKEARFFSAEIGAGATAALSFEKLDMIVPYVGRYRQAMARVRIVPIIIIVIAAYYSWVAALIFMITGPLIPVFMALIGWAAKDASENQMAEMGTMNDMIVDRLPAILDMRLLNTSERFVKGFTQAADRLRTRTMAVLKIAFLTSTVLELFAAIGVALMAIYLGFSLLGAIGFGQSWGGLTPFSVIWILLIAPEFYQSLRDLSAAWHDKAAASAVADDWQKWFDQVRPPVIGAGQSAFLGETFGVKTIGAVAQVGQQRIQIPDFEVKSGQGIAITGPSGAGKSTALNALAGLVPIVDGAVHVNGQVLDDDKVAAWRDEIGWMPQAPHFFDDTLQFNLDFGTGADIWPALKSVDMADVVDRLPNGAQTKLGETGGGLSGGEARRLTLCRAILANPKLIIADEPTADLDPKTAEIVTNALLNLKSKGVALIVSTHDARLAERMDQVIEVSA
ncbi:hypothetical protein BVC71_07825 [Marivivens niveibacter]|uniref:Thiol reductant ABC exporter subunit CydD n=1 Tax=Marivivens niveibacter TaxID=1930667 RepID=A0A251WZX9_9RHOB|nr:hypothetical protein BVC71_07825 [Marivivens niveibacter]